VIVAFLVAVPTENSKEKSSRPAYKRLVCQTAFCSIARMFAFWQISFLSTGLCV